MSIKDWCTVYPLAIDITSGPCGMPDLFNNEDLTRVSQIHAVRDAAITLERLVGTDGYEYGSIRYHIHDGYLMLGELNPDPVPIGDRGIVFCKYDGDSTELHWMDEYGHILKFTNYGYLNASLDSVYDGPDGYGSGRIMAIDEGPVVMNKSVDDDPALEIVGDTDPHLELLFVEALNQDGGAASISVETYTNSSGDNWCYWGGMYSEDAGGELGAGDICGVYLAEVGIDTGAYDDPDSKLIAYEAIRLETDAKTIAFHATDDGTAWTTAFEADSGNMALHDGYVQLGEVSDPTTDGAHGFVFCQQDNYSELFFMNSNGDKLQLTKDGRLNATLDSVYDGPDGSGSGRSITADSGAVFIDASGTDALRLDGYLQLDEISDPTSRPNSGMIYAKDDGGNTELFYMDDGGNVTQLTEDGYLATFNSLPGVGLWEQSSDPTPATDKAFIYVKDAYGTSELHFMDNYGVVTQVTTDGYANLTPGILQTTPDDPDPRDDAGFIYSADVDGYVELHYMDNYGSITQITADGYLAYTPESDAYWDGYAPTTVQEALDRIAAALGPISL